MLRKIEDLPNDVVGVRAEGKITRDDYENILVPLFDDAAKNNKHIRFLYQLGPEFSGLTAGAIFDDARVGIKYWQLFEQVAIVSDVEWVQQAIRLFGSLFPCPARIFENNQFKEAVTWLTTTKSSIEATPTV